MRPLWWLVVLACVTRMDGRIFTPVFYRLDMDFSSFSPANRLFDAVATIYFNVSQGTFGLQEILLDAEQLNVNSVQVLNVDTGKNIRVVESGNRGYQYSVRVKLDEEARQVKALIQYRGQVGSAGDTGVFITEQQNVIGTNSYPLGVRKIFPCVNDPTIRTSFHFNVKLVNNTWGLHQLTDGVQSPFLPAHAVGFIMTHRYRKVDDISTNRFVVWVPNDDQPLYDSVNNNRVLKNVLAEGTYFDGFLAAADLDKVHVVMVPGLQQPSVVSHRLISIRPDFMIWSQNQTAEMAKGGAVATINALSKHFFRCVVSPKNWQDFWLADSLALYLQYALLNHTIFQDPSFPELFITDLQRPAMRGSTVQVNPKTVDPSILDTVQVYPPAYQGASVLKMVEALSSQKELVNDFFHYYNTYVYSNVDTKEFLSFLSKGSVFNQLNSYGKDLGIVLDAWLHQTGYPYLTDLTVQSTAFTLSQVRFMGNGSLWFVPFVYRDESDPEGTLQWLSGQSTQVQDSNTGYWLFLNKQSRGMFRVNYRLSLEQLLSDQVYWKLTGAERAALVDDAYELARQGISGASLDYALSLFDKITNETDYVVLSTAMLHVNKLSHLYGQKGLADQFELKMAEVLNDAYLTVSWYNGHTKGLGRRLWTRSLVEAACAYYVPTCQQTAASNAHFSSQIISDLWPTVNCYEIRSDKQTEWAKYFKRLYDKSACQYTRADALYALACPQRLEASASSAIAQYLNTINSDSILPEDALRAFSYIYSWPEHTNQTFNYIQRNFSSLLSRFGDGFVAALITDVSDLLLPEYYDSLLSDLKQRALPKSRTYNAIVQAQVDMAARDKFVTSNLDQVRKWLGVVPPTPRPLPTTTRKPNGPPKSGSSVASYSVLLLAIGLSFLVPCSLPNLSL